MKSESLDMFLTARTLFDRARDLCIAENRIATSSGLIILQDAVELLLLGSLVEIGVDERESLENLGFIKIMQVLKKNGIKVPKVKTLEAMNKQRVIVKHYGQLAEPRAVRNYYETGIFASNKVLKQVIGKELSEVMAHDLIKDDRESSQFVLAAIRAIEEGKFHDALVEIRKALYVEVLANCSIEGWRDYERGAVQSEGFFELGETLRRGGWDAPFYTRNKDWIDKNVRDPFDYIQLDLNKLKMDLMEWGVSTQDFWNLWRLTPSVFRFADSNTWAVKQDVTMHRGADEEGAKFCLDRIIELILKRQEHFDLARSLQGAPQNYTLVEISSQAPLYRKASINSETISTLQAGSRAKVFFIVPGLEGDSEFVSVSLGENEMLQFGYIERNLVKEVNES